MKVNKKQPLFSASFQALFSLLKKSWLLSEAQEATPRRITESSQVCWGLWGKLWHPALPSRKRGQTPQNHPNIAKNLCFDGQLEA